MWKEPTAMKGCDGEVTCLGSYRIYPLLEQSGKILNSRAGKSRQTYVLVLHSSEERIDRLLSPALCREKQAGWRDKRAVARSCLLRGAGICFFVATCLPYAGLEGLCSAPRQNFGQQG